jgi:hypothetical protein
LLRFSLALAVLDPARGHDPRRAREHPDQHWRGARRRAQDERLKKNKLVPTEVGVVSAEIVDPVRLRSPIVALSKPGHRPFFSRGFAPPPRGHTRPAAPR